MAELQSKVEEEREWWERRKKGISEGFMKELDNEASMSGSRKGSVAAGSTQRSSSDDDAVLVERAAPAATQGTAPDTPASAKKKKGKK